MRRLVKLRKNEKTNFPLAVVVSMLAPWPGLAQSIPLQVEALGTVRLRYPRVADQHWRLQNDRFCDT